MLESKKTIKGTECEEDLKNSKMKRENATSN